MRQVRLSPAFLDKVLKAEYGITLDEYNDMLQQQDYTCAVCNEPETIRQGDKVKRLSVDHDHETGKIRSLLCHRCNTALGLILEDKDRLLSLIQYIDEHKT